MTARHAARLTNGLAPIPQDSWMRILPPYRKRLVDFNILASLDATSAENALIRVVSVKRVRVVHFVRLRLERNLLMLNGHLPGRVMHRAIAVVIVADGAVEHVISQDP